MGVQRTGVVTNILGGTSGSQVVDVPADAEIAIFTIQGFSGAGDNITGHAPTLGGTPETLEEFDLAAGGGADNDQTAIFALVNPPTGTQTLAWSWAAGWGDGGQINLAFYKGVDAGAPFGTATGGGTSGSSPYTVTVGPLGTADGDAIVGVAWYWTEGTVSWTNLTGVNTSWQNGDGGSYGEGFPTGDTTVSFTNDVASTTAYVTLSVLVLKQATAGGTAVSDSDLCLATDAASLGVGMVHQDSSLGVDSLVLGSAIAVFDLGAGGEQTSSSVALSESDAGTSAEGVTTAALLAASDLGTGGDAAVLAAAVSVLEQVLGLDVGTIGLAHADVDTGAFSDHGALRVLLAPLDGAEGLDATSALFVALTASQGVLGVEAADLRSALGDLDLGEGLDDQQVVFGIFVVGDRFYLAAAKIDGGKVLVDLGSGSILAGGLG